MKPYLLLFGLIWLCLQPLKAQQRQAAFWAFGTTYTLDFNEPTLNVKKYNQLFPFDNFASGWATICDKNGNFLFGANGNRICDKEFNTMKGGEKLSNQRLTRSGGVNTDLWMPLILERGNGIYWTFYYTLNTCSYQSNNEFSCPGAPNGSINRAIVDMNQESGYGVVVRPRELIDTFSARQMAIALHQNGRDAWLITHGAIDNEFRSYAISDTGLNKTPVISHQGPRYDAFPINFNSPTYPISGAMISSPNSELIATKSCFVTGTDSNVYVFKINRTTGAINKLFSIKVPQYCYGLSFSSNSNNLYCFAGTHQTNFLYQYVYSAYKYDLSVLDSAQVLASVVNLGIHRMVETNSAMLGPTGAILFGQNVAVTNGSLGIITNPNGAGNNVGYNPRFFSTATSPDYGFGFPILNQTLVRNAYKLQAAVSKDTCCPGDTVNLYGYGAESNRFLWDANQALLANNLGTVRAVPTQSTSFQVKAWNGVDSATATTSIVVVSKPQQPIVQWDGRDSLFVINPSNARYFWYQNDTLIRSTNAAAIRIIRGQAYRVRAVGAGCMSDPSNLLITNLSGQIAAENLIQYGPNPSTGLLTIRSRMGNMPLVVRLRNVAGLDLGTYSLTEGTTELDLGQHGKGLYFLEVKADKLISKPVKVVVL
jgi:hypothetical protein